MAITGPLKTSVQLLRGGEPAIGPGKALVLDRSTAPAPFLRQLAISA